MRKRQVAGRRLGGLEAEVMEFVWSKDGPVDVHDVIAALKGRKRAYTTVMTIVTRLHQKGMLERERRGKAFVYRPAGTREELAARAIREVLANTDNPQLVLARLVDDLGDASPELLRKLRELVRKERRR